MLRSYKFNRNKIGYDFTELRINVTNGQIKFECKHLRSKLKVRDQIKYNELLKINLPDTNPVFRVVEGDIEPWEVIQK